MQQWRQFKAAYWNRFPSYYCNDSIDFVKLCLPNSLKWMTLTVNTISARRTRWKAGNISHFLFPSKIRNLYWSFWFIKSTHASKGSLQQVVHCIFYISGQYISNFKLLLSKAVSTNIPETAHSELRTTNPLVSVPKRGKKFWKNCHVVEVSCHHRCC